MAWIPGGTFAMGSEDFYPGGAARARGRRGRVLDGRAPGDRRRVPALRARDEVRDGRRAAARPGRVPGRDSELLVPGSLVFRKTPGPVNLDDYRNWWEYLPGRVLEAARREGHDDQRPRPPPGRPHRLRGRRGLRGLGGKGATDRGGVGARRPRRPRGRHVRLGRRAFPGRQGDGQLLAGRVPLAEPEGRRLRGDVSGRQLPTERVRPLRHDRERLGVDLRLVRPSASRTRSRARAASRATRA